MARDTEAQYRRELTKIRDEIIKRPTESGRLSSRAPGEQVIPRPASPAGVGDMEGAEIARDLFELQRVEREKIEREAKEVEVAEIIHDLGQLNLANDGTIIYWTREFQRTDGAKTYRYAALFSDGLWWITGRHTHGRTTEEMIVELIRMEQTWQTIELVRPTAAARAAARQKGKS